MSKNNCRIYSFSDDIFDNMISYTFNNYLGGSIPTNTKGEYIIEYVPVQGGDTIKLYVKKEKENTRIQIFDKKKNHFAFEFNERNVFVKKDSDVYKLFYMDGDKVIDLCCEANNEMGEFMCDIFFFYISSSFVISRLSNLPFKFVQNKKNKMVKKFFITKTEMEKLARPVVTFLGKDDFSNLNVIEFSSRLMNKLLEKTKVLNDVTNDRIYLPYEEFGVVIDKKVKIHCKFIEGLLKCNIFSESVRSIYLEINIENINYKYYVFDDFENIKGINICNLSGYITKILKHILNFMAFYSVKKTKRKAKKDQEDNMVNTHLNRIQPENKATIVTIDSNKVFYKININNAIKSGVTRRKTPVYKKNCWNRRGYIRTCRSGKKVYVNPTVCKRKVNEEVKDIPITPNGTIYKIK